MTTDLSPLPMIGTYITFMRAQDKAHTQVWRVLTKYGPEQIGWVSWYTPWHKYAFHPNENTVYEQVCLREIATFCERATAQHKAAADIRRHLDAGTPLHTIEDRLDFQDNHKE